MRWLNLPRYVSRFLWIILAIALAGCGSTLLGDGTADLSIRYETAQELLNLGTDYYYEDGEDVFINVYCHTADGPRCYFVNHDTIEGYDGQNIAEIEDGALFNDLSVRLIGDIGPQVVERTAVKVRCQSPVDQGRSTACQLDRGEGWERLDMTGSIIGIP
jgi:hypothetical protein